MKNWFNKAWVSKTLLTRRLILPVLAIALVLSFTTYEFAKPAFARAPIASPTATPLDDNSVGRIAFARSGNGNSGRPGDACGRKRCRHFSLQSGNGGWSITGYARRRSSDVRAILQSSDAAANPD